MNHQMPKNLTLKKPDDYWSGFDHEIMSLALRLAEKGKYTARPNPMVGCVLVKNEQVVGQGWHQKFGENHAEVNALEQAGNQAKGAVCYVTLEPCSHRGKTGPCVKALIGAGIIKVVAAMQDPNPKVSGQGFKLLLDAGIEVEYGLFEQQAKQLNRGFVSRFTKNRPWITCKLAMSLDGRTALADGSSQWITGTAARADVQKLRAKQDAIITASGTVLADNPSLTVRAEDAEINNEAWFYEAENIGFSQPSRVLLDRYQSCDTSAKLFNKDADVFWISDQFKDEEKSQHINYLPNFSSLENLLSYFAEKNIHNLLIEAGHNLAGEFLKANLIDELVVYMAPKLMGNQAKGLFNLAIDNMSDTNELVLNDLRHLGDDIRLTYLFKN